ncbi:MAG: EAL domain-containing protein [Propionivibrio sp.]
MNVRHPLGELDYNLLEVFCGNIAVAFENTHLLQRISELAYEDSLLKMPNRNRFLAHIDQRQAASDRLALVDLDGFADINSVLDQDFGDAVLQVVAQRLRDAFPEEVHIARIGSDVFGLLGPQTAVNPERIEAVFSTPFEVGDESFRLSATSGLVRLGDSAQKAVELLKNAGVALKQAKSFNRGKSVIFETALATAARGRMQMLSQLRLAFSVERLFLVYQPFIDLASNRVVGAEALLRWRREDGEFVPPDQFIPLAEQSGLMVPIGDWVTRSALRFLKDVVAGGHRDFRMAINVSHVQFREPDYVARLAELIDATDVDARHIEIELTESVAIDNVELIERKLAAIHELGVSISIDDFGVGYSSLYVLRQLNVDRLKIDRAFISGKDGGNADFTIAGMVIQLAGQLGLETIAEGIETPAQRVHLARLGCRDGQGYLFAKPMTGDKFAAFLRVQPA